MPSLHDTINQANELLDNVRKTVRDDFGKQVNPMLSEADRQRFIAEEEGYVATWYIVVHHDINDEDAFTVSESVSKTRKGQNQIAGLCRVFSLDGIHHRWERQKSTLRKLEISADGLE